VGVVAGALPDLFTGRWSRLVNPVHALAAGLWIGTLFVLLVAGIAAVLRDPAMRERRGAVVADMVNGFSPLALSMGMVVVVFGVITAWRHLTPLSSLWSTPYGYALLAKLLFVAMVFALGAWNWRRQRPTLGSDESALSIRRSSRAELGAAAVVLVLTAILLSLPSPRRPKPPGAAAPVTR
jgi:putative copper export protein